MDSVLERHAKRIREMTADEQVAISHAMWLEARSRARAYMGKE